MQSAIADSDQVSVGQQQHRRHSNKLASNNTEGNMADSKLALNNTEGTWQCKLCHTFRLEGEKFIVKHGTGTSGDSIICIYCKRVKSRVGRLSEEDVQGYTELKGKELNEFMAKAATAFGTDLQKCLNESCEKYRQKSVTKSWKHDHDYVPLAEAEKKMKDEPDAFQSLLNNGVRFTCTETNREMIGIPKYTDRTDVTDKVSEEQKRTLEMNHNIKRAKRVKIEQHEIVVPGSEKPLSEKQAKALETARLTMAQALLDFTKILTAASAPEKENDVPKKQLAKGQAAESALKELIEKTEKVLGDKFANPKTVVHIVQQSKEVKETAVDMGDMLEALIEETQQLPEAAAQAAPKKSVPDVD